MKLKNFEIHPLLKGYIEKLWLFESNGGAALDDVKLIVPNGRLKLAIPYKNGLVSTLDGRTHLSKEHDITIIGLLDRPSTLDMETDSGTGTICAEFSPYGAYRFFSFPLNELTNNMFPLAEVCGKLAKELQEAVTNTEDAHLKAALLQQFFIKQFLRHQEDVVFEFAIKTLTTSHGKTTMKQLEKLTGYSSRWLNMKFIKNLGVSPKNIASILRFKNIYIDLNNVSNNLYDHYFDQSHYIKDFKRFTGFTPTHLNAQINNFGKMLYEV